MALPVAADIRALEADIGGLACRICTVAALICLSPHVSVFPYSFDDLGIEVDRLLSGGFHQRLDVICPLCK